MTRLRIDSCTTRGLCLSAGLASVLTGCASLPASDDEHNARSTAAAEDCLERRGDRSLVPSTAFRTDGCSLWPDGNWRACCIEHDMDYWCGGAHADRRASDRRLRRCVSEQGRPAVALLMYSGVRIFGVAFLPFPWRWGFGWPWPGAHRRTAVDNGSEP